MLVKSDNKSYNSKISREKLDELSQGLNVDVVFIETLQDKYTLQGTMMRLGNDACCYDNQKMAGRMNVFNFNRVTYSDLRKYIFEIRHILNDDVYNYIKENIDLWQDIIDKSSYRDYKYDWFSSSSLIKNYLIRLHKDEPPIETIQQLWMRVTAQLYYNRPIEEAIRCFEGLSKQHFTHATPTLCNSGTKKPQLSSCFLMKASNDLRSIKECDYQTAILNKHMGGVGYDMTELSGQGALLWNGYTTKGTLPWIKIINETIRGVDQGGRRNGVANVMQNIYHIDIEDFIQVTLKNGDHNKRAHNINTTLWIPWLFFERYKKDEDWTLFCPTQTPELNKLYGKKWIEKYIEYENDSSITLKKTIKARQLYDLVEDVQRNSGMPYIMSRDSCNFKSNHEHLGIVSTNLCLEIVQHTEPDNLPVCNLASITLRKMIKRHKNGFSFVDYEKLARTSRTLTRNLYQTIKNNWYALEKNFNIIDEKFNTITNMINSIKDQFSDLSDELNNSLQQLYDESKKSTSKPKITNNKYKPIGIGVTGFSDFIHKLDLPFVDIDHNGRKILNKQVKDINKKVFACIYYNAIIEALEIGKETGEKYERFEESYMGKGLFQFDLWKMEYEELEDLDLLDHNVWKEEDNIVMEPKQWNQDSYQFVDKDGSSYQITCWDDLKLLVKENGIPISLFTAPMPTATSSQITRSCETTELHQNNLYTRKLKHGIYTIINRHMYKDLKEIGIYGEQLEDYLRVNDGSLSNIDNYIEKNDIFPQFNGNWSRLKFLQRKYLTMWEVPTRVMIDLAADRGRYIDQSQSLNLYIEDGNKIKVLGAHIYGMSKGLKTIMYYLRQVAPTSNKVIEAVKSLKSSDSQMGQKKEVVLKMLDKFFVNTQSDTQLLDDDEPEEICYSCQC